MPDQAGSVFSLKNFTAVFCIQFLTGVKTKLDESTLDILVRVVFYFELNFVACAILVFDVLT